MFYRVVVALMLVFAAGCVDRAILPISADALNVGTPLKMFVATTRGLDDRGYFDTERVYEPTFANLTVSVPPVRWTGSVYINQRKVDPNKSFVVAQQDILKNRDQFRDQLAAQLRTKPAAEREVVIYVHGYNNSYSDGVFRMAQMMTDLDLKGVPVHYSWPSAAHALGYTYDRDSMLYSRDGLEEMLRTVSAAGPKRILLIGHSMGAMLVMETLRQMDIRSPNWAKRSLGGVILISPDVDVDVFQSQSKQIANLPQPFAIFVSNKDRALAISAQINGSRSRVGNVQNAKELSNLPVTLIDVTNFSSGFGHFTAGTSQTLISILGKAAQFENSFRTDRSGVTGLLPGTVITVQKATQVILSPDLLLQDIAQN